MYRRDERPRLAFGTADPEDKRCPERSNSGQRHGYIVPRHDTSRPFARAGAGAGGRYGHRNEGPRCCVEGRRDVSVAVEGRGARGREARAVGLKERRTMIDEDWTGMLL